MSDFDFEGDCQTRLEEISQKGLRRTIKPLRPLDGGVVELKGRRVISFCSNDYLGLSQRPEITEAVRRAIETGSFGSTGSRLLSGERDGHCRLENELAAWLGYESALLFSSGYQANVGVISAILTNEDCVIIDREVHASIVDGCRLSRAKMMVYRHLDMEGALRCVEKARRRYKRVMVVTESLFSMSGRFAPIKTLAEIARSNHAILYVDEAHALGVVGEKGRGWCEKFGVRPDILVGTCGKAIGTSGAFVTTKKAVREYLINSSRALIFTTAVPEALSCATKASIELINSIKGDDLREQLAQKVRLFVGALSSNDPEFVSPIVPVVIGDVVRTAQLSESLLEEGFLVPAIRPPTVSIGRSQLRVSISASHSDEALISLAAALKRKGFGGRNQHGVETQ